MQTANRVVLNTIVQYVQLLLNVVFGLFTVRILLNSLGASDYGIYDLISGVVFMLSFIGISLSQTSMRFLSVSLGEGDNQKARKTFSICLWLHFYIALLVAFMLFVAGLILFHGFLNIPDDRIATAQLLYHFMVFGLFLNIIVTPFSAIIAAHERFIYLSCIQILDTLCKFAIAFVIASTSLDKLLVYGFLMTCILFLTFACYVIYVFICFEDSISLQRTRFSEMKEVTGFAGWTLLDVIGSVATRQGYAVLLNVFFGTVVNAVFALSRQIEEHMYTVSASVINTMKPQIMISQGSGDTERMFRLSMTAGKFGFSMMSLIAIPLLVMLPEILILWLGEYPKGTVLFTRLFVSACMVEQLTRGLVYANQAVGNIKWFSIIVSAIRLLALPISWLFFYLGFPAYVAIIVFLLCETIGSFSRVIILSIIADFKVSLFINSVIFQLLTPFVVSILVCFGLYHFLTGIIGLCVVVFFSATCYISIMWLVGLTTEEKLSIKQVFFSLKSKISQI